MELSRRLGHPLAHAILIAVLGLLVYANTFDVPFQFDDGPNIVKNPIIKNLSYYSHPGRAEPLQGYAEYPSLIRRYIGSLTFALDYHFHGLDVRGYHVVNLVVHIACALLVYILVLLIFRTPLIRGSLPEGREHWAALMAGALFVSHPVQTEAVTYIVQRFASLAALFYLGAVAFYVASRMAQGRAARWTWYGLGLVSAVLAMKTKETAFTLPLAIVLFETLLFTGEWKRRVWQLVPYMATIVIIPATLLIMRELGVTTSLPSITHINDIPHLQYLETELRVLVTYMRLMVLPVGQNLDYDYPLASGFMSTAVMLPALVHLVVIAGAVWLVLRRNIYRVLGLGVIWFYITISVESTLITLDPIFEHRLYLPSAGLCMAAGTVAMAFYTRLGRRVTRGALVALLVTIPLMFGVLTVRRNSVWQSEESLWADTALKSPNKARPLYTLGRLYHQEGRLTDAINAFRLAIRKDPESYEAHVNYAVALWDEGFREQAVQEFERSLMIVPSPAGYYNLGVSYFRMQMYASAAENFRQALALHRNLPKASLGLAQCYLAMNEPGKAEQAASDGLVFSPGEAGLYLVLGEAQLAQGKHDEAVETYRRLVNVDPDSARVLWKKIGSGP